MTQKDKAEVFHYWWRLLMPDSPVPVREYYFAKSIGKNYRFDAAWPDLMVAVEIDGGQWLPHGGSHNRDKDRIRSNHAQKLGWTVLRYSTQQLDNDPQGVIDEVLSVLEATDNG